MSVLKSLEAKIEGLVEGTFSKAFKSRVQPAELARKLAKEMRENQTRSVSRVYVPTQYAVFLSPADRESFASFEPALKKELSDYLLEDARREGLALVTRPQIAFKTDERLGLGEFGIQVVPAEAPPEEAGAPAPDPSNPPSASHTMVYAPDREEARRLVAPAVGSRALLVGSGRRTVLSPTPTVIGRSREADVVVDDPNVSRRHAQVRREGDAWVMRDMGSTNGVKVNGRRVEEAVLAPGDELTIGKSRLVFEVE